MRKILALALSLFSFSTNAQTELVKDLAPKGKLRAAVNFGNPVLAQKNATTGQPQGVSVDLARELAKRLNVPLELVLFDAAGKVSDAAKTDTWDIAFLAIDPNRAKEIAFTPPYVIIEGTYMVHNSSPLKTIADVDRENIRIAVGKGSVYDLYLTRTIKNAQILRAPTSPAVIDFFLEQKLDVAAGVRQQLVAFNKTNPQMRIMEGRFQVIEQALATPINRAESSVAYLKNFIEEAKSSGFVQEGLKRSNQLDAQVAPPAK